MELSAVEARRMALRAQGLGVVRPRRVTLRQVRAVVSALGAVQLDAVNVLVRSHYLTLYSRLGPYRTHVLDDLVHTKREAFEYWGHAASVLPIGLQPALRWRMDWHAEHKNWKAFIQRLEKERPGYAEAIEREVRERGPLTFGELTDPARTDPAKTKYAASSVLWERWSDGKLVLEGLLDAGRLAAAGRRGFERLFDLTDRVIPADVLAMPTPEPADAQRTLVLHAAKALGVATARDLADYFRLPAAVTKARLRELVDSGELQPAQVEDWPDPAYLHPAASAAKVDGRALLSPFDSLLWERSRVERLFGFRHSFELYVKPVKRVYGYYVLPFLLGENLVARVDLKADRKRSTLLVQGAFAEPRGADADALAEELRTLADWLELDTIEVTDHGDLARQLPFIGRPA